jgi:hypothetical protein
VPTDKSIEAEEKEKKRRTARKREIKYTANRQTSQTPKQTPRAPIPQTEVIPRLRKPQPSQEIPKYVITKIFTVSISLGYYPK